MYSPSSSRSSNSVVAVDDEVTVVVDGSCCPSGPSSAICAVSPISAPKSMVTESIGSSMHRSGCGIRRRDPVVCGGGRGEHDRQADGHDQQSGQRTERCTTAATRTDRRTEHRLSQSARPHRHLSIESHLHHPRAATRRPFHVTSRRKAIADGTPNHDHHEDSDRDRDTGAPSGDGSNRPDDRAPTPGTHSAHRRRARRPGRSSANHRPTNLPRWR